MIQTLIQSECQIVTHQGERLIGICQNANCDQISRRVCMKCVNEKHQKHKDFQFSDISSFGELINQVENLKLDIQKENAIIEKQCRINKFLLLKEIQEYIQFWQQRYKEYEYVEQIVQQINEKTKYITLESYLHSESQRTSLKQFFQEFCQRDLNNLKLILSGLANQSEQQKIEYCKSDLTDNINDIINKMQKSILQSLQMSIKEMYKFMITDNFNQRSNRPQNRDNQRKFNAILEQKKELQTLSVFEKFIQFFQNEQFEIPEWMQELSNIDIYTHYEYNQDQICRMGDLFNRLGQTDKSQKYYNNLINLQPQNTKAYIKKVEIMKKQKNYQGAIECLDLCIKINPNYGDAYKYKALILEDQKTYKEAIECLDQCIKINPNYGNAYKYKALILEDQKTYKEAIECLDQCIKINPNYGDAYYEKAEILKYQNEYKEAIGCLDECIKINPNYGYAYKYKALILEDQKTYKEAIECLDQCIKINPNYGNAYKYKALILEDQKTYKEAIECLDQCIKNNPKFEDAYIQKAWVLIDQEQKKEAIECLDQCIKNNPNYGDAYCEKAWILEDQKTYKEAIECLDQCIQFNPNYYDAIAQKGRLIQYTKDLILFISMENQKSLKGRIQILQRR